MVAQTEMTEAKKRMELSELISADTVTSPRLSDLTISDWENGIFTVSFEEDELIDLSSKGELEEMFEALGPALGDKS